jgi:hypothetical protein
VKNNRSTVHNDKFNASVNRQEGAKGPKTKKLRGCRLIVEKGYIKKSSETILFNKDLYIFSISVKLNL